MAKQRRPKYRNKRTEYNGVNYASKAEAARAEWLNSNNSVASGTEMWIPQPKFRLGCPENVYVADFFVVTYDMDNGLDYHVEDVKGPETPKFKRDKKLWAKYGPCELHIVKRKGKRWDVEIVPGGAV